MVHPPIDSRHLSSQPSLLPALSGEESSSREPGRSIEREEVISSLSSESGFCNGDHPTLRNFFLPFPFSPPLTPVCFRGIIDVSLGLKRFTFAEPPLDREIARSLQVGSRSSLSGAFPGAAVLSRRFTRTYELITVVGFSFPRDRGNRNNASPLIRD